MINRILISNKGDVYEGLKYTTEVVEDFENVEISHDLDFEIMLTKKDVLEDGKENIEQFSNMFLIFGTFSIIAGIILIVNIFVMLSEERKSEMGMVRAIGMQRKHLKRMYIAEGTIYALIASFIGVFFGIGIGYIIIFVLKEIFSSFGDFDILQYFTFSFTSLIIGFVSGFLITIFTIYVTSHRISKLNIVRAIRNIPEPIISRSDKRMMITGFLILFFGLLLLTAGIFYENIAFYISGLSFIVFGIGLILRRWIGDKISLNLVGIIILIIWILPADFFPEYSGGIEMFIVSGLFLVFAALIIVMSNSELIIKGLTFLLGRGKSGQAVIKTAVSYALKSKFRTGMTIAIFALIIFTITTMSMMVGMLGTNIENQVHKASGGYEIIAFSNPLSPIEDIEQDLKDQGLFDKIEKISAPVSGRVLLNKTSIYGENVYYSIIGVDDNFINENEFEFAELKSTYKNEKDAWNAIKNDKNLIIIDGTVLGAEQYGPAFSLFYAEIGDTIQLRDKEDSIVEKEIIGILDSTFIQGIFSYEQFVKDEFEITESTIFLFSAKPGENVDELAKDIESAFLKNGMQVIAVRTMVLETIETMKQFFYLFDAFMALGLIIGIAGLGIITIRSVHERRQEIGMMRAIGFKRRMVLSTFLIETSIISILGILIGTFLGIFTGYILWRDEFNQIGFEFYINWQPILTVAIIAFIFTMICIIPASRKASKIPPAEALRYEG
jgi:putative ABC transport system permease protein